MFEDHEAVSYFKTPENLTSFDVDTNLLELLSLTERGKPATWGSTPANPHRPDVFLQQQKVRKDHEKLFPVKAGKIPFDIDVPTAVFIRDCNSSRFEHRTEKNFNNYEYRGIYNLSQLPATYREIVDRVETGNTSPSEIIFTDILVQVPAIELGSIAVGYGKRMELLKPMQQAIDIAVDMFDGINRRSTPVYQVKQANYEHGAHSENVPPCLLMTRTINTGFIPEQNIVVSERSSFVLRLDELSKQYQNLTKRIMEAHAANGKLSDIADINGLSELLTELFDKDDFETLVPISVTGFAINYNYEHLLHNEEYLRKRAREHIIAAGGYLSKINH
jgi:hypothetical protein